MMRLRCARRVIPAQGNREAQSTAKIRWLSRLNWKLDLKFDIYRKFCNCQFQDIYMNLRIRWISSKTDRKNVVCYWRQLFLTWSKLTKNWKIFEIPGFFRYLIILDIISINSQLKLQFDHLLTRENATAQEEEKKAFWVFLKIWICI